MKLLELQHTILTERELAREKAFEQLFTQAVSIWKEKGLPVNVDSLINEARRLARSGCDWCDI